MLNASALRRVANGSFGTHEGLQEALLLRAPGASDEPVILSTDPSVWPSNSRVIDLTQCLNIWPLQTGVEANLQRRVVKALQTAGWPAERIVQEYRPDLKSGAVIDIALLNATGICEVAVEIKREIPEHQVLWEQLYKMAPGLEWYCFTDGRKFVLRNRYTRKRFELQHAFSPQSLVTQNFMSGAVELSLLPHSFGELREL